MKYAVISDIHANLEALTVAINYILSEGISTILCCGDIVGYGPDPSKCLVFLRRYDFKSTYGNHDKAIISDSIGIFFNEEAVVALNIQKSLLSKKELSYLQKLPYTISIDNFILTHSSLNRKNQYKYILNPILARENLSLTNKQILFIGHSHKPGCFILEKNICNYISSHDDFEININDDNRYLINVGSIGQPRDSNPKLSLAVYDQLLKKVKIVRLYYPITKTQEKMKNLEFPEYLVKRLENGI